jgi:hypothetical protein
MRAEMMIDFPLFLSLWNAQQGIGTPKIHHRIAGWLMRRFVNNDRRLLLMAFRACGKSTLVGLYCAWLLYRDPNTRILVLAADLDLARKMVRNIKRIIEKHPLCRTLIPETKDQWAAGRFTVKRTAEWRDPSVLARAVGTNLTGSRADIIICDDVEVPKTCDTKYKRDFLREWLRELDFIRTPHGTQIYIGTPHSWYSLYADAPRKEMGEAEPFLDGYKRLVLPILNAHGVSVWPERFSDDVVAHIRKNAGENYFQSQMMCKPNNLKNARLDPSLLITYADELDYREQNRIPVLTLRDVKMVSARAWWDPAFGADGNDKSVLAIIFSDAQGRHYIHDIIQMYGTRDGDESIAIQQCHQVIEAIKRYHLPQIIIENNGIGKFLPSLLKHELRNKNVYCRVVEQSSRLSKSTRILQAFEVPLAARALYMHERVRASGLMEEMEDWRPDVTRGRDDCLDAVAGALSMEPVRLGHTLPPLTPRPQWTQNTYTYFAKTTE